MVQRTDGLRRAPEALGGTGERPQHAVCQASKVQGLAPPSARGNLEGAHSRCIAHRGRTEASRWKSSRRRLYDSVCSRFTVSGRVDTKEGSWLDHRLKRIAAGSRSRRVLTIEFVRAVLHPGAVGGVGPL